jgi:6-phosphogluconolactonase
MNTTINYSKRTLRNVVILSGAKNDSAPKQMPNIQILPDPQALYRAAANEFVARATDAVNARGLAHVALSGGSTPKGLFALLVSDDALRQQMPWDKIHFWWSDERHVPPDHPDSNFKMANDAMLSRALIPAHNIHRVRAELEDASQAALEYEQELRTAFQLDLPAFPQFDLILLGMGPDAHTASLFPGTRALNETTRLVVANWVGKLYTWRITFTAPLINAACVVLFLVAGDDKALPLKGVLEGPHEPLQLPAQLIQPENGSLLWLLVSKAASQLVK